MPNRMRWARTVGASLVALATILALAGCSSTARPSASGSKQATSTQSADASGAADVEEVDLSDETSEGPAPSPAAAEKRYVDEIAKVRLGATDASVTKLLGPGLFTTQEGEGGGRYYVDAARTVTLHVEIGADSSVASLELSHGIVLPAGLTVADDPKVISRALTGNASASKGIKLGMSVAQLTKALGKPAHDERSGVQRIVSYEDNVNDSDYWAEFVFVGDHLRDIWVSNGT
jgi:hypothetical protein